MIDGFKKNQCLRLISRVAFATQKSEERLLTHLLLGEFGDGLGAFRDSVLGKLSWEDKADGGLDLAGGQSGLVVVSGQVASFFADAVKDVVDEGVHDAHTGLGDASVGVDLLEHTVDVAGVGLDTAAAACGGSALDALSLLGNGGSGLFA